MAFDPRLADRVRKALSGHKPVVEKKMFGGLAFMHDGHMCCGVLKDTLILRLGEAGSTTALQQPHVREMDFTGKPMKSMVIVTPDGLQSDDALRQWIRQSLAFVKTLPPKTTRH